MSGERPVEQHAERKHVVGRPAASPTGFGRCVPGGAEQHSMAGVDAGGGRCHVGVGVGVIEGAEPSDPQVDEAHIQGGVALSFSCSRIRVGSRSQEHIRRFNIAVDHTGVVQCCDSPTELTAELDDLCRRQAADAPEVLIEGGAVDPIHGEIGLVLGAHSHVDRANKVTMVDAGEDQILVAEAGDEFGITGEQWVE